MAQPWWFRQARKVVVAVIGGTVLLFGLVMFFTPGPGLAGTILGLAILATEFVWARRLLKRVRAEGEDFIRNGRWWKWIKGRRKDACPPPAGDAARRQAPPATTTPPGPMGLSDEAGRQQIAPGPGSRES
jgi:hypothetical protein